MFYTKYRPQKFSDLIGLESLSKAILTSLKQDKLAHAYFFYGPRGTGKTTVARLIAKAVNCESVNAGPVIGSSRPMSSPARGRLRALDGTPPSAADTRLVEHFDICGVCSNCVAIQEGRFLDLIEIDAASNRGIDDIRAIKDKVSLAPSLGRAKVYIIDEVHMLTTEAFNALLKTLEEPPKRVYFVLCTTDPQKVPDTIKSRCVKFEFKRASEASVVRKLKKIIQEESLSHLGGLPAQAGVKDEDLKKIAKASIGGFRDAETLLEEVLIGGVTVDEVLSGGGNLSLDDFIDSLNNKATSSLTILHTVYNSGVDLTTWTLEFLSYLRSLLLIKAEMQRAEFDVTDEKFTLLTDQAAQFKIDDLTLLLDLFSDAVNKIKDAAIPTLPLEVVIIKWFHHVRNVSHGEANKPLSGPEDPGNKEMEGGKPKIEYGNESGKYEKQEGGKATAKHAQQLQLNWEELLKSVRPYNHSVEAVLRSCRMVSCDNEYLQIEVFYSFHKERLETPKNKLVLETVLNKMLGRPVRVKCILGKKGIKEDLSDKNVDEIAKEEVKEVAKTVLEVFDGGIEV